MLPLSDLEVTHYRGLRDLSLKDLGKVNLLVGPNNSGKTSVLEAISLVAAPLDPWTWISVASRREPPGLGGNRRTLVERLRWMFPQHASQGPIANYGGSIGLSIAGPGPVRAVEARFQELRSAVEALPQRPAPHDESTEDELEISGERRGAKIDVEIGLGPDASSSKSRESFTWWEGERFVGPRHDGQRLRTQVITPYDHWYRGISARMYSQLRVEEAGEDVIRLLSLVDPRIIGLEVLAAQPEAGAAVTPRAELYLRDRNAGLLPVDAFGDGMRRILLMALGVTRARAGLLLIDEIETAIHVSALGHVFRWIVGACASNNVQLFATTHSLEALDAILAADTTPEEDVVGYRLEARDAGVLAHRYSEDLLKRLRTERGIDVR